MGLILDLIPDPPAVLWSFTTQASSVDFYIQPDYIARPLTWTVDFGTRNSDYIVPDGTIEHIPSYVSAHPGRNRENATGSGGTYYVLLSGVTFSVPELVSREFDHLDTAPYSIAAVTTLDARGFIPFDQIDFTVFNQRGIEHEYSVTIDWGDGTSTTDTPVPAPDGYIDDLSDWTYPHSYAAPGIYVITVTTTAAGVTPGEALDSVALYWMITPVSPALVYGCTIDWGDASTDTYTETATGNPEVDDNVLNAVHAYEDAGPHTISITTTEGRWTPSFLGGAPGDITAIGPMACGFRLGVDLTDTFVDLGQNVPLGTTIDPDFSIDNAVFLVRTFYGHNIYCYSRQYPLAPAYPFKLPRYREGDDILYGRESYITYELASSMANCPLLQSAAYEYKGVAYPNIYENLQQEYFTLAPDDTFDRLLALWDAGGCSAGRIYGVGTIKSVVAWQHYQSLLGNGWVFDSAPYENLGFYLSISDQSGLPHTHPAYEHELWIDPIAGGYALKFTIHRTPWSDPEAPSTATVDWVMTRTTWTRTLVGSIYTFAPGSPVTLGSGTATFTPNQASQLITVNHVGTLNPLNTYGSSVRDNIAITLSNAVDEDLSALSSSTEGSLVLGGPAGVTDTVAQAGVWVDEFGPSVVTPIAGGVDLTFVIYRVPVLNPAAPGTASIQWSLLKKDITLNSSWASTPAWTTIGSGTESFSASQNRRVVNTQYLGAYTPYVNDNTTCTVFRLELHTPVNERLGTSTFEFVSV
jgi:hypothetical protein